MGNYLANRRIELGLTQKEVADAVGVTEATVSRWESGTIANMRRDKISLLAKALQTSPNFIMTGEFDFAKPVKELRGPSKFLADIGQQMHIDQAYDKATDYDNPLTAMTQRALFFNYHLSAQQYDDDALRKQVTLEASKRGTCFHVPEELMFDRESDQTDVIPHLVEILSYMRPVTPGETREKLHWLLSTINEAGVDKVLSYVEGLIEAGDAYLAKRKGF